MRKPMFFVFVFVATASLNAQARVKSVMADGATRPTRFFAETSAKMSSHRKCRLLRGKVVWGSTSIISCEGRNKGIYCKATCSCDVDGPQF